MAAFHQTFNAPVGQIINANGDVILNGDSNSKDLTKVLEQLTDQIKELQEFPIQTKEKSVDEINFAITECNKPFPNKNNAERHLKAAADLIGDANSATSSAVSLAKTLLDVGKWLNMFL